MANKECRELAGEFQVAMLCDQIEKLEHIESVKKVAKELVHLNQKMKSTFEGMVENGWLEKGL
nr:hypothetical protein [uncultured Mediterranean phage uvMED]